MNKAHFLNVIGDLRGEAGRLRAARDRARAESDRLELELADARLQLLHCRETLSRILAGTGIDLDTVLDCYQRQV